MKDVTTEARAAAVAEMVLGCIHREYPVHVVHLVRGPQDLRPPRDLTPAFYGSFDWHSSVHGHWCLIRLARRFVAAPWRSRALAAVGEGLTRARLAGELAYLAGEGRQGFERPYGLAWLLQLAAELREWTREATGGGRTPEAAGEPAREAAGESPLAAAPDPAPVAPREPERDATRAPGPAAARAWHEALAPLESLAAERMVGYLERLPWPVRGGEHAQTAFALGLALDWAREAGRADVERAIRARSLAFFLEDRAAPVAYEPSGHDFLSPSLGEADLLRRLLEAGPFADWLERFLPDPAGDLGRRWLTPVASPDRADGKLSHLDGLNLSRAWMLEGIAATLPGPHPWREPLGEAARRHAEAGLAAVPAEHYAGAHWLGSFAVYLLTRRGLTRRAGPGAPESRC